MESDMSSRALIKSGRMIVCIACTFWIWSACDDGAGAEQNTTSAPSEDTTSRDDASSLTNEDTQGTSATEDAAADPDTTAADTHGTLDTADAASEDTNPDAATDDALADDATDDADSPDLSPPAVAQLWLNEAQCSGSEWVELVSADDAAGALDGWIITDNPGDPARHYALHGEVAASGFVVAFAESAEHPEGYTFKLDCDGERLFLLDSTGQVRDQAQMTAAASGAKTLGRIPDGVGAWVETAPTPGEPNVVAVDPLDDLFDPLLVHTIDLTLSDRSRALLDLFPREYAEATFTFTPASGPASSPQTVGARIKGRWGSFRTFDQKPALKLRFNWLPTGPDAFMDLSRMTLNNMVQDPSNLHEWAAYAIFRKAGVPAPRLGYVSLRVNGAPYGLYANIETLDARLLSAAFPSTGHLYEGSYGQDLRLSDLFNFEVDEGSDSQRSDLLDLIDAVESTDDATFFTALAPFVDWDTTLTTFAVEQLIGHWDGYSPTSNNYFIHFTDQGLATWLPWGTDQTFEDNRNVFEGGGVLFSRCMRAPDCRAAYRAALRRAVDAMRAVDFPTRLPQVAAVLRPHIAADPRREQPASTASPAQASTLAFIRQRLLDADALLACYETDQDPDGDGFICEEDCRPNDPDSHPGAIDTCGDLIDQDCNGWVDDDPSCPDCAPITLPTGSYWFCTRPRSFLDARTQCQSLAPGADLAVISTSQENTALWSQAVNLREQHYWIGLDDLATEGQFLWSDGTLEDASGFNSWSPGEPNNWNDSEDCAHLWSFEPSWNDISCAESMGAICEALTPAPIP
jgi:hypothetical protein